MNYINSEYYSELKIKIKKYLEKNYMNICRADEIIIKQQEIDKYLSRRCLLGLYGEKFAICMENNKYFGQVSLIEVLDTHISKYTVPGFVDVINIYKYKKYLIDSEIVLLPDGRSKENINIFNGNKNIIEITLGKNVKTIELFAFNFSSIKKVNVNSELNNILQYAFSGCRELTEFDFSKLTNANIADYAFKACKSLIKADLKGVNKIGEYAFFNCKNLKEVKLSEELETIGNNAFNYCNIDSLIVPDRVCDIRRGALGKNPLKYLKLGRGLKNIESNFITTSDKDYCNNGILIDANFNFSEFTKFQLIAFNDKNIKVRCNKNNVRVLREYGFKCNIEEV